jgi:hypothetical protein
MTSKAKNIDPKNPEAAADPTATGQDDKAAERKTSAIRSGRRKLGRIKFK